MLKRLDKSLYKIEDGVISFSPDVTEIPDKQFQFNINIKKVILHSRITKIGEYAFFHCLSLSEIVFSEGIREIGWASFKDTAVTSLKLPDSLVFIRSHAFEGCRELVYVSLGRNIEYIGQRAFGYSSLKRVEFYQGKGRAKNNIFDGCNQLTYLDCEEIGFDMTMGIIVGELFAPYAFLAASVEKGKPVSRRLCELVKKYRDFFVPHAIKMNNPQLLVYMLKENIVKEDYVDRYIRECTNGEINAALIDYYRKNKKEDYEL